MNAAPWEETISETLPETGAGYFPQMNADLFRGSRRKDPEMYTTT